MSVNSNVDFAIRLKDTPREETAKKALQEATKQIAAYIPTEILGPYVAIVGLTTDANSWWQWGFFIGFLILTPFAVLVVYAAKKGWQVKWREWPRWAMTAGVVSFVVWVMALPGSVFNLIGFWQQHFGSTALIAASVILWMGSTWTKLPEEKPAP